LIGHSERHLDGIEIDALLSAPDQKVDSDLISDRTLGEVRRHAASCQDCDRKVQMHRSVQSEIARLASPMATPADAQCPLEESWLRVAAGLVPAAETKDFLNHAAKCGHCGPLLRQAADALSDETTPKEERMLAELRSAQLKGKTDLAAKLRPSPRQSVGSGQEHNRFWESSLTWPRWAFAGLAIIALSIAGWVSLKAFRAPSAEDLLAEAYTERRTLALRFPKAKYAPMHVQRGGSGAGLDRPPSLLRAESLIAENLRRHPNDPTWLQAKARADLLDGNYAPALQSLQHALEAEPRSDDLLIDLASAYFQRAETAGRPIDYGNAIGYLSKSLARSPNNPIALFNRAIVSERALLYAQAIDDWEHYLRVDPKGLWHDEAQQRLVMLRERSNKHDQSKSKQESCPPETL